MEFLVLLITIILVGTALIVYLVLKTKTNSENDIANPENYSKSETVTSQKIVIGIFDGFKFGIGFSLGIFSFSIILALFSLAFFGSFLNIILF